MLNKNTALMIAGIVFGVVALVHLLRLAYMVEIVIGGYVVPMWASALGFVVATVFSIIMLMARKKKS